MILARYKDRCAPHHRKVIYLPLDGVIRLPEGYTQHRYYRQSRFKSWNPTPENQALNEATIPSLRRHQDRFFLVAYSHEYQYRQKEDRDETYAALQDRLFDAGVALDLIVGQTAPMAWLGYRGLTPVAFDDQSILDIGDESFPDCRYRILVSNKLKDPLVEQVDARWLIREFQGLD